MAKQRSLDAEFVHPNKIGMKDCFGYAFGDAANLFVLTYVSSYLKVFLTDILKVAESKITTLLLIARLWDAINDPLIGSMIDADRRKYKRGKFLTYIFIGSIGLLVAGAATFAPFKNASDVAKIALYVGGYVFWDAFYTVANVPYGSMLPLITEDAGERAQLSAWRNVGAMIGGIVAGDVRNNRNLTFGNTHDFFQNHLALFLALVNTLTGGTTDI